MKRGLILIFLCSLMSCGKNDYAYLLFNDTKICVPSEYVPGLSPFGQWIEDNVDGLDSSDGSEIIRIPPEVIKSYVPDYTISHINKHGVDLRHEISGIAYKTSSIGSPDGMAHTAWQVYEKNENPLVVMEESGHYRIYPWGYESFSWDLVKSPPPEVPTENFPDDWYIGYCGNTTDSCFQSITYKDIWYQYHLQLNDLEVRDEVESALFSLFESWENNCNNHTS
ncbi:hypothetical protein [Thalassotalea litorea]|uniref:hypothetical protein n=1 Tax=Thalassotalea litorea TaxID=2020715 RepID=UPI0037367C3A